MVHDFAKGLQKTIRSYISSGDVNSGITLMEQAIVTIFCCEILIKERYTAHIAQRMIDSMWNTFSKYTVTGDGIAEMLETERDGYRSALEDGDFKEESNSEYEEAIHAYCRWANTAIAQELEVEDVMGPLMSHVDFWRNKLGEFQISE